MRRHPWLVSAAALLLAGCASAAARNADPAAWRGRALAARSCAGCHAVNRAGVSLLPMAPPFRELAPLGADGLQALAADVHRRRPDGMPPIVLTDEQASDLYAYVRTLRGEGAGRLPDVAPCFLRRC